MMTSSAGGRQVSDLIRHVKEDEIPQVLSPLNISKPHFIWVYEWDLYEPLFTRNWTFTYHLPLPGYHEKMKKIKEDGNSISKWIPMLTAIPELSGWLTRKCSTT
ncbi:hypothetical protein EB796_006411 [Bugula neritina]|uniref:Uncharacterized protein n=1 Tax=Bugula neritina TaxID=10212 RepID=A0A7J7KBH4_BUGNE|nr:hypothetical protein EB796_006411 [Bugula neritina]